MHRPRFSTRAASATLLAAVLLLGACQTSETVSIGDGESADADSATQETTTAEEPTAAAPETEDEPTAVEAEPAADEEAEPPTEAAPTAEPEPTAEAEEPTAEPEPTAEAEDPTAVEEEPTTGGASAGDSPADKALIDAVAAQMNAEGDIPPGVDSQCFAGAVVRGLGGAEGLFTNYGLSLEAVEGGADPGDIELPIDEARALADGMLACGIEQIIVNEMVGDGFDAADGACLIDALDDDVIRDLMAAAFVGSEDAAELEQEATSNLLEGMFAAFAACDIDPSALGG